jgi:hypothetical protein
LILESSKPKTLIAYSQNFQDLGQTTIRANAQNQNFAEQGKSS